MDDGQRGIAALDDRIPFLLAQLGSYVGDDFQHRLAPIGVEPRTYAVLAALAADDGQSQRQLSDRLGIHRNAMVNTKYLERIARDASGQHFVHLRGLPDALEVSRRMAGDLKDRFRI